MSLGGHNFSCKKPKLKENPPNPQQALRSSDQFKSDQESNQAQIIPESRIKIEQIPAIDLSETITTGNKTDLTKLSVTQNRCSTQQSKEQTQNKTRNTEDNLQSTEEYVEPILEIKNENKLIQEDSCTKATQLISTKTDQISITNNLEEDQTKMSKYYKMMQSGKFIPTERQLLVMIRQGFKFPRAVLVAPPKKPKDGSGAELSLDIIADNHGCYFIANPSYDSQSIGL